MTASDPLPPRDAEARRARVARFARATFGPRGTLALHRHALGLDLLRAPLNVALSPVFLAVRLLALLLRLLRVPGAGWLARRQVFLPTAVSRAVEDRIATGLLGARRGAADLPPTIRARLRAYGGVRAAVAEITTSLIVLAAGAWVFGIASPGVISLAPLVSDRVAHGTAVADFPLGRTLGGAWYAVFPVHLPAWYIAAVGLGLAMAASVVTTFAGLIADPVQVALGIHRRRLLRLLGRIERDDAAEPLPPEHLLARLSDLTDAGLSLLRWFRP